MSAAFTIPGSDLSFYKVSYNGQVYFPLFFPGYNLRFRTEVGYGERYGDTQTYPFYENFYAGGFGSVRGWERNTLGPRSTSPEGDPFTRPEGEPIGGNLLVEGSAEIIFPVPFVKNPRRFRALVFFDAGNVFNQNCSQFSVNCFGFTLDEIRYSVGAAVTMISGMGPMTFALSFPLNATTLDETEGFTFELGRTF